MNNKKWYNETHSVHKGWGSEFWAVNKPEYCGKVLVFGKGKKCSFHYHLLKDEVFLLHTGCLAVKLSEQDDLDLAETIIMRPGDTVHVYPGLRHQMIALEHSELFEFSTQHFDDDSYRIVRGD